MSENPYDSPTNPYSQPTLHSKPPMGGPGQSPGSGYVKQINVIAILTLVQGGLLLIMGIFYSGYAALIGSMPQWMPPDERARMQNDGGEFALTIIFWAGLAIGALILASAIMHFVAGYKNLHYQGRIFSIVTWGTGLISVLTCYCLPTSIGLLVYGLIIFLNPATARAFELRNEGMSKQEIDRKFY